MIRLLRSRSGAAARVCVRQRTGRELVGVLGRTLLWLALGVVLVRGAGDLLGEDRAGSSARERDRVQHPAWPDDAARAFAVEFATAYLTHRPTAGPAASIDALRAFASPSLVSELAPRHGDQEPSRQVRSAAVAGTARIDDRHALVTVAATLQTPQASRRLLTVPIARDRAGGLVVYELPAFAPARTQATATAPAGEPLLASERAQIQDVLTRFLRAYLAGDTGALAYLVPPDTAITAAAGRFELVELGPLAAADRADGDRERVVLVTVHARDAETGALYALRYRLRLVRRDRWYIAGINGGSGLR